MDEYTDVPEITEENPVDAQTQQEALEISKREEAEKINTVIAKADIFVRKEYLSVLDQAEILPLSREQALINPLDSLRLMKMDSFVFGKDISVSQKLKSIYGSLSNQNVTAVLLLDGKKEWVDLYLGVSAAEKSSSAAGYGTFRNSLNGALPGCQYRNIKAGNLESILNGMLPEQESICVAAIPGISMEKQDNPNVVPEKLDALVDGMRGKPFSMILLAQNMTKNDLVHQRQQLESLYTQIAPLQKQDITLSENESDSYSVNASRAISESLTCTTGTSRGKTETTGTGKSSVDPKEAEAREKFQAKAQLAGSIVGLSAALLMPKKEDAGPLGGLFIGNQLGSTVTSIINSTATLTGDMPPHPSQITEHTDRSVSVTDQESEAEGSSTTDTQGDSTTTGTSRGRSIQRSFVNKSVMGLLENIEQQIKQTECLEREGAFKLAAYFIAGDQETAVAAANLYRSSVFASGKITGTAPICQWSDAEQTNQLKQYLRRGLHPEFSFGENTGFSVIQAAQPVAMADMGSYFALPERSLPGLDVADHASFARDILIRGNRRTKNEKTAEMGCVYHMGREEQQNRVILELDELTKHLFVAGATGVGKSNFCYQLLDQALDNGVKVMVVEPAKGEYAKVFGGRDGFRVFGTNLRYAPLLRINPFAFPDGVHVSEHIDRLMDIFKAAWPLTAAMPAILKDSVEQIYEDKGFDMILGDKPEDSEFPCFADLLAKLPQVISRSDYSSENKGNYTGALVTRVKSLTNGIFGSVFNREEVGDSTLFDENCVIDLSRVGSGETKALLMGVLVMRLSEYRMCSGIMNSPLRHITLLEEAHHLLRRDAGTSVEGANAKEASVEMITNAIAEMRTYGEGFVIADQSPSVLHPSAIRNTQTKAFFKLPDQDDRAIAGNSISLTDHQKQELSKLTTGVAVMHHSRWTAPVLCKLDYFPSEKYVPYVHQPVDYRSRKRMCISQSLSVLIKGKLKKDEVSSMAPQIAEELLKDMTGVDAVQIPVIRKALQRCLTGGPFPSDDNSIFRDVETLLDLSGIFLRCSHVQPIEDWAKLVHEEIRRVADLQEAEIQRLVIHGLYVRKGQDKKIKDRYNQYFGLLCS